MSHIIGISGSTIFSASEKLPSLFVSEAIRHIEIGEFSDQAAFDVFLSLLHNNDKSFALHVPLMRNDSKYDLLETVSFEPEEAWRQFEDTVRRMSELNARYVLVHFPYFKQPRDTNMSALIENALIRFREIQEKYAIPIVCEAKLGIDRSTVGLEALHDFPIDLWNRYGIKLCIDVGDYLLAFGDKALHYIEKWSEHIMVVHLHNVDFRDDIYIWVPAHPIYEEDDKFYRLRPIIEHLSRTSDDLYFILEHTPETAVDDRLVDEAIVWVQSLIS